MPDIRIRYKYSDITLKLWIELKVFFYIRLPLGCILFCIVYLSYFSYISLENRCVNTGTKWKTVRAIVTFLMYVRTCLSSWLHLYMESLHMVVLTSDMPWELALYFILVFPTFYLTTTWEPDAHVCSLHYRYESYN